MTVFTTPPPYRGEFCPKTSEKINIKTLDYVGLTRTTRGNNFITSLVLRREPIYVVSNNTKITLVLEVGPWFERASYK